MDIMEMGASDDLTQKWGPALDGIDNDYTKRVTAQLLENQLKSVQQERVDEADGIGAGTTTVGRLGTFQKFAFPLVRRVFPELIANQLVSVQPMSGPVSQVFYLGQERSYEGARESLYSKYQITYRGLTTGIAGGADALSGIDTDTHTTGSDAAAGTFGTNVLNQSGTAGTNMNSAINKWAGSNQGIGWSVSAGELLRGDEIPEVSLTIEQSPVIARTRKMRALWTLEASQDLKAYHNLDLERELTDLLGKEIRLEVDREMIEDLRGIAYDVTGNPSDSSFDYGMLDQQSTTNQLNLTPAADSTFESFQFFTSGEANVVDHATSSTGNTYGAEAFNLPGVTQHNNVFLMDFFASSLNFAPRHIGDTYSNLLALINFVSQDIYKTTQRGAGNWLLCAPHVATMLETAARLAGGIDRADGPTNFGPGTIQFRGKFMGRYDLFVDPLYPEGEIMMGYKGGNPMDGGYIYAPYIPFQALPTITDPETFQPRKGILTRYGKVAVAPASRFYRIIRLVGSNQLQAPFIKI